MARLCTVLWAEQRNSDFLIQMHVDGCLHAPDFIMSRKAWNGSVFNRWFLLIWLVSLCGTLGQNILINTVALYVGAEVAGTLSLAYAIFAVVGRLGSGYLADHHSRRLVMVLGCLIFSISTFLFGSTAVIPALFLLRGLHGMGFAAVNTAAAAASVDVVPPESASRGVGWFWVSLALAGAVSAYIGLGLNKAGGFDLLFDVTAVILAVGAVLAFFCRFEGHRFGVQQTVEKADYGYMKTAVLPIGVLMFLISVALSSVNNYALLLAKERGYSLGGFFFLFAALFMMPANSMSAKITERLGVPCTIGTVCILLMAVTLLAGWINSQWVYLLLSVAYGLLSGIANPVLNYLVIRTLPEHERGMGSSILFVFQDLGFGIGGMVFGWAISSAGFGTMYSMAAAMALTAFLLVGLFKRRGVLQ